MKIFRRGARGFSLIELMIAITLGMIAVAAVGSVFIYGSRNYKQDDKISRMQDELRFAMAQLALDLEMTGFFAQIRAPATDIEVNSTATVDVDCGPTTNGAAATAANTWTYQERRAFIDTLGNASATAARTKFPCIETAEFQEDTDIIAIKRLGRVVTLPQNDAIYLRTNGVDAVIYKHSGTPPAPTGANVVVYEYQPVVWFIRRYAVANQDPQVASLCRRRLTGGATPSYAADCVAQGIQDLQLEFGIDSVTNPDGLADSFVEIGTVPGGNPAERTAYLARVVAVRVHLLARSAEPDVGYRNVKTYTLGSKSIPAPNDAYYRKALSTNVLLRNPANRLNPFALPNS